MSRERATHLCKEPKEQQLPDSSEDSEPDSEGDSEEAREAPQGEALSKKNRQTGLGHPQKEPAPRPLSGF